MLPAGTTLTVEDNQVSRGYTLGANKFDLRYDGVNCWCDFIFLKLRPLFQLRRWTIGEGGGTHQDTISHRKMSSLRHGAIIITNSLRRRREGHRNIRLKGEGATTIQKPLAPLPLLPPGFRGGTGGGGYPITHTHHHHHLHMMVWATSTTLTTTLPTTPVPEPPMPLPLSPADPATHQTGSGMTKMGETMSVALVRGEISGKLKSLAMHHSRARRSLGSLGALLGWRTAPRWTRRPTGGNWKAR